MYSQSVATHFLKEDLKHFKPQIRKYPTELEGDLTFLRVNEVIAIISTCDLAL